MLGLKLNHVSKRGRKLQKVFDWSVFPFGLAPTDSPNILQDDKKDPKKLLDFLDSIHE